MMQPNEKGTQKDLVLYRIETSKSDIKAAEILLAAKEFRGANNRAYYGIYHAISAVHALDGNASEINNIVAKIPGWERLKTPRKFDGYGQQRGFRKIAMKTIEEESENSEFVVVSEQEQMELPFD